MGYKKISHKNKEEGKIKRCVECRKCYIAELGDDTKTCPSCIENLLQPCPPMMDHCKELDEKLDNFFNDPMTKYYGAQDCSDIIVRNHRKDCKVCRQEIG